LIDRPGKTDAEIYNRANIDRRLFNKIRNKKNYTPSKQTILALAIALELPLDETLGLLERAGYALSHNREFDVIFEYYILKGKYDIFRINELLLQHGQPLLGAKA
jgi:transcriptional regulator with XRE-family HTH domain